MKSILMILIAFAFGHAGPKVPDLQSKVHAKRIDDIFTEDWQNSCSIYCAIHGDSIAVNADSFRKQHGKIEYTGEQAHDFNFKTAWVEGDTAGYGIGKRLVFTISQNSDRLAFTHIFIANGYHKSPTHWSENSRVKRLKLTVDGTEIAVLALKDDMTFQKFDIPAIPFKQVGEQKIAIEILEVYPGTKFKDVALSEINWGGTGHH